MTKLFWTTADLESGSGLLRHYVTATVCQNLEDAPDGVLRVASKTCRYEIRQAEKLGARIGIRRSHFRVPRDFVALHHDFAQSKSGVLPVNTRAFGRYRGHADTFVLYLDQRPLCGHMVLRDADSARVRLLYSSSRRLEDKDTARLCGHLNRLLHLHEMRLYREEGFVTYDFGGIPNDVSDGITRFKLSFGGHVITEHTYLCAGRPWLGRVVLSLFENLSARGRPWRRLIAKRPAVSNGEPVHKPAESRAPVSCGHK
jgi:hypothetical protein